MLYSRPDLMHRMLADQRRRGGAVPERADRGRRAGRDGVRQLGRRAGRRRVPGTSAWPTPRRVLAQLKREHDGAAHPAHRVHQGRRPVAGGDRRRSSCDVVGLDWTVNLAQGARAASATAWRCRATSTRTCCSPGRSRSAPRRSRCSRASARSARRDGTQGGHVFNLGHGISQHTPPENVSVLVDAVHEVSRRMRARPEPATRAR